MCSNQNTLTMKIISEAITGNELRTNQSSPYEALVEFYDAFNHCKLELMQQNWANSPDIAMDNPLGGILRGWHNIKSVYERIFTGQAKVYVEFYDYSIHEAGNIFYAIGRERGSFEVGEQKIELAIRTSRIYQKMEGRWQQVHHHGSIESPELLSTYQKLVRK